MQKRIVFYAMFILCLSVLIFYLIKPTELSELNLQPVSCTSATCSLDNADGQCIDDKCVLTTCLVGYCNADGHVLNGCEVTCDSQQIIPMDLVDSFAPATTLNPLGVGRVTFNSATGIYEFDYSENGIALARYTINSKDLFVQKGSLRIYDALHNFYPVYNGGAKKQIDAMVLSPLQVAEQSTTSTFAHEQIGNVVKFSITTTNGGVTIGLVYLFEIVGKTLIIRSYEPLPQVTSYLNYYNSFTFSCATQVVNPVPVELSYLADVPITRGGSVGSEFFYSAYVDYSKSGSNNFISKISGPCGFNGYANYYNTNYVTKTSNPSTGLKQVLPFEEVAYVTVSNNVDDVVLAIHSAPDASRSLINNKVIFDNWRVESTNQLSGTTAFERSASLLEKLSNYGLTDLAVIHHQYSQHGRDCGYPDKFPFNALLGGDINMGVLKQKASTLGYLFGLDITFDMAQYHPNSEYDPAILISDISLNFVGDLLFAWTNPGCNPSNANPVYPAPSEGYVLKANNRLKYAQSELNGAIVSGIFDSIFIDVYTAKNLAGSVDYDYSNLYGSTLQQVYRNLALLISFQKTKYASDGPVFGEGSKSPFSARNYYSSIVVGTDAEIIKGENAKIIPDFELKRIKTFQANHGVGYSGRWITAANIVGAWQKNYLHPNDVWSTFPNGVNNVNFDKYDASTLAFGHTGFLETTTFGANNFAGNLNNVGVPSPTLDEFVNFWVQRYYIFRAIQEKYLSSEVVSIEYFNEIDFINLDTALKIDNFDFVNVRLKIVYQNGLEMYLNLNQAQTWNVVVGGVTHYLPSNGWVAIQSSTNFLQYSALVDSNAQPSAVGNRADYVRSADYIYADARGTSITFEGYNQPITTNGIVVQKLNGNWQLTEQIDGTFSVNFIISPISPSNLQVNIQ